MKSLLIVTAAVEGATGLGLLVAPGTLAPMLLGGALDDPGSLLIARVAGAALLAIALACWGARRDAGGPAAVGVLKGVTLYNVATVCPFRGPQ